MPFRITIFHAESGLYLNTNHESDDYDAIVDLADSDLFAGASIRVVDQDNNLVYEPKFREKSGDVTIEDIAAKLDVPIVSPEDFESFLEHLD